ncbi:MBL fold metallo-hydrolase [Paractinoplanes globisporus]|uniref:MBL fold metallo-hydrolase n=1 Tax=Paractinoplanes globisporus TaxID=113565 RepID=A0ABW6WA75_9ACTN|nr:MBL fold metallo-hydrolase [Actinoplanes globisporus]
MIVTGTGQHEAWQQRVLPPVEQVRPGVWSIPVPIPHNPLRYTLSYAFLDDADVLLVDPGWDTPAGREAVTAGLGAAGARPGDVTGVVVTHVHPDHHGLSGWLREHSGAWIGMHPAEARSLPGRLWRDHNVEADRAWLLRHGVPEDEAPGMTIDPSRMDDILGMAEPDRPIEDGDLLPLTRHGVRAIWTPGHTPGHLCLHDAAAGILLTGDHLLPRISPNIGVHEGIDGDPLGDYLDSLELTAKFGADEALPAHEYRFRGIDDRAAALIRHHDERGHEILGVIDALGAPTAWAIAAGLTWSRGWDALRGMPRRMALSETLAHLHHLAETDTVRPDDGTPVRWRR